MGILCLILFACLAFSVITLFYYKDQYDSLLEIYKSYEGVGVIKETYFKYIQTRVLQK